jgi:protein-tyrosine phosphatase
LNNYIKSFNELKKKVKAKKININLYRGCEIYVDDYAVGKIIDELNCGKLLTINGTKHILVEFNPYEASNVILKCIKKLSSSGYAPILAHTERHLDLSMNYRYISLLQESECMFQINAYSIVDESDKTIKKFAMKLLNEKKVSFIGSDAHRTSHRPYMIHNGIDYIYKHCDFEYADAICYKNAKQMLDLN